MIASVARSQKLKERRKKNPLDLKLTSVAWLLAQVLQRPQLIFPSKIWFF
jgi:hypothetical protein